MTETPRQTAAPSAPTGPVAPDTAPTELQRLALQEVAHPGARPVAIQALIWLFRAYSAAQSEFSEALRPVELSTSAFNVLQALVNTPGAHLEPCDIADRLLVSRPSVTGLLDTLEGKELISRAPHPADRRRVIVRLTDAGRALLDAHYPNHYAMLDRLFADLDDAELGQLVTLLRRLQGAVPASLRDEQRAPADED